MLYRSKTITTSIDCPTAEVYGFLAEPLNLPTWTVLIERIEHREGNDWAAQTPDGEFVFSFSPRNELGVLDNSFRPAGETEWRTTPVRVFPNGDGTELTFTLFQTPGIGDAMFESEAEWIRTDLLSLKALLESRRHR